MKPTTSTSYPRKRSCWLSNFNKEDINADFSHPGKRIYKKKIVERVVASTGKVRKFDIGRKDAETRNNKRNVDAFTVTKANKYLKGEDAVSDGIERFRSTNHSEVEDTLIEIIDLKNSINVKKIKDAK